MLSGTNGLMLFALASNGAIATAASNMLAPNRIQPLPGVATFRFSVAAGFGNREAIIGQLLEG
jgi:hypothetical protein